MHGRGSRSADWDDQEAPSEAERCARARDESDAVAAQMLAELNEVVKDEAKLRAALVDPHWRLCHLYWIIDKSGNERLFVPNAHQQRLFENLAFRNLILKARQLGFSTAIQLQMLDSCLFIPDISAAVIAQNKDAANVIFRKIKFAYDHLHPVVRAMCPLQGESVGELILANKSSMRVATSVRSSTLQFLHVSEFGKICAKYPAKAREVVTGSLPAAQSGIIFIESTAEGREGAFYEMTMKALANHQSKKELGRHDYRFYFAGWWEWENYRLPRDSVAITGAEDDYFIRIESEIGRALDNEQRAWYIATRDNEFGGDWQMMKQEYPSTPDEAFEQSQEGVYYAEQLAAARRQVRITDVPYDPRVPVNTFWDIGKDDDTCIWFHQHINGWDNWIDYYECSDQAFSHYARILQERGYVFGRHYIPHDGGQRQWGADQLRTSETMLNDVGVKPTVIVPRTPNLIVAIGQVRDAFPRYRFDQTKCKAGLHHLDHYRKSWNERFGAWSDAPLKNGHQHAADAIRQHAQAFQEPVLHPPKRRRKVSGLAV
jgi:hypothetical protein